MAAIRVKIEWHSVQHRWRHLPSVNKRIIWAAIAISFLIHLISWLGTGWIEHRSRSEAGRSVKIRSVSSDEKRILDQFKRDSFASRRIIETPQTPTVAPKVPASLGAQDHATERETKIKQSLINNSKGQDASNQPKVGVEKNQPKPMLSAPEPKTDSMPLIESTSGTMIVGSEKSKTRTPYERLLPDKTTDVFSKTSTGYTEHIDAPIAEGDRVDMNTTSFKFLSYFSGLRKQIELVWIYPSDAIQRGLQGAVQLEMTIEKDGRVSRVRVVQSSGYQTLDDNMLRTIKMASPFAPLPKAWGKDRLVVTGSFHYILSFTGH